MIEKYVFKILKMYFELKSGAVKEDFDEVYDAIKDKVAYATKGRRSCLFFLHKMDLLSESYSNKFGCEEVPQIIERIRTKVELMTGQIYDYVLVHIYLDGTAGIAWHSDKEAVGSFVCSVSLGISRKFRLRKIGRKTGYDHEFILGHGDIFVMKPQCQSIFQHCVAVEKSVKDKRINLTFRQYEI